MGLLKKAMTKERMEEITEEFKELVQYFEKKDVHYWVDWGTLLGVMRENSLFPHEYDSDIDITIFEKERKKIKRKDVNKYLPGWACAIREKDILFVSPTRFHFSLSHFSENKKYPNSYVMGGVLGRKGSSTFKQIMIHRIRFFFYTNETFFKNTWGNKKGYKILKLLKKITMAIVPSSVLLLIDKFLCMFILSPFLVKVPKKFLAGFKQKEIDGFKLNIPANAEKYLEYRYGKDWLIKNKDWDTIRDDPTITKRE